MSRLEVYPERAEKLTNIIGLVVHLQTIVPFYNSKLHLYAKRKVAERETNRGLLLPLMATWSLTASCRYAE
jgi:hypothetical protein